MGKCLLWEVEGRVAVVHSSSPIPHLPLQLDHQTGVSMLFLSCKCHPWKDLQKFGNAAVRREMEEHSSFITDMFV